MMSLVRSSFVRGALLFVGSLAVLGCGAGTAVDDELETAEAGIEQDDREHAGKRHRRGPGAMVVSTALEELDLSAEQRTQIQGLFQKGKPSDDDRAEHEAMAQTLADAVRAGKIDVAAFAGKEMGRPDKRAAFAADLDTLHAILSADQRKELVAALRQRAPQGPPEGESDGDRNEAKTPGRRGPGGPLGFLLRGIELSDDQKVSIQKALTDAGFGPKDGKDHKGRPDHADIKAKIQAVMDAFVKEEFKAADVLPERPEGASPHRMLEALAVAVPLLTAEQRGELADRIERGPMGRGSKGKGEHGPAQDE